MSTKNILVTGANGQLGKEMQAIAASFPQYNFVFVTKEELPIDDVDAVKNYFSSNKTDVCVNCAAYTAVDKAETETAKAFQVNAIAVGNLAAVCKEKHALFIHISTDYVFDGTATAPYKEDHTVHPVNAYGASKLKGEELALQNNPDSIIIRTSWVYSSFGNNFVKTMLRLMSERESINVVDDQVGCPTYAADLAAIILKMIDHHSSAGKIKSGIYNFSNKGAINWYQFATAIKELSGSHCTVNPIPATLYPTPAKRPNYSVLDTTKIQQTFNAVIPAWKDSLEKCLKLLGK
jgi:dTDP-4-dehydrorhamnose reductase